MSVYGIMANLMKYGRAASTEQIVKQTVEARWYLMSDCFCREFSIHCVLNRARARLRTIVLRMQLLRRIIRFAMIRKQSKKEARRTGHTVRQR